MDPFSISVGAVQIVTVCSTCTVSIIKWVGDVRTVDSRIRGFYDEILALKATYEGLDESLRSPLMIEAARVANGTTDGAHLWAQVRIALDDSTKTVKRIKAVLDDISKHTGPLRSVKKQLTESLSNGELSRLRQRIQFFNATISLPIQMVCLWLQLEQRGLSSDHQRNLDTKFMSLERTMRELIQQLSHPSRSSTLSSGSTLMVGATNDAEDVKGKESYLTFAKKILQTASAAASTRSSLSTMSPQIDGPSLHELGSVPPTYSQSVHQARGVPDWLPNIRSSVGSIGELQSPEGPGIPVRSAPPRSKAAEISYKLAHNHLKLGQEKADQGNHESAEKSLRKALDLLSKHDFSGRIAFQPAEVVLMLAQSCAQQKKYAEAIDLLKPVAARESNIFPSDCDALSEAHSTTSSTQPDTLLALAASHMLGEVYLQQGDFEQAKEHALKAFLERSDQLGDNDAKTLESVRLVIQVYRSMGDEEEAEAYEALLTPITPIERSLTSDPARSLGSEENLLLSASPSPSDYHAVSPSHQNMAFVSTLDSSQTRSSRPNLASRLRNIRKLSQPNQEAKRISVPDSHRQSFSRSNTLDDADHTANFLPTARTDTHQVSTGSEASNGRTASHMDNASAVTSTGRLERSSSMKTLEPTFLAISALCSEGKTGKAVKIAMKLLESYNANNFIIRRDAMEKNIKESGGLGLAGTGHGYSPLHFFCELKEECVEEVTLLVRAKVDVNCIAYKAGYTASGRSPDVLTPLHLAIKKRHSEIAKILLGSPGVRPDMANGDGFVPLLAACRQSNEHVVQALLSKHVPKCIPRNYPTAWYGNSVLHDAARHCDLKIVDLLLTSGHFDVNQQDQFGKTALIHAVVKTDVSDAKERAKLTKERTAVVCRLLDAGADVNLIDHKGSTARGYAEKERFEEGRDDLLELLGTVTFEMA
jgi:tetratricopeptide (TPR) repeat protein